MNSDDGAPLWVDPDDEPTTKYFLCEACLATGRLSLPDRECPVCEGSGEYGVKPAARVKVRGST